MEQQSVFEQIAARTNGGVYLGVVGPVRTGKSTFVKRFMEQLVLPNIENVYQKERARDELPQSGSGRTIMTSEPKFVPEEAVQIQPDGKTKLSVRLIDTVGYLIPGAAGAEEDGAARMVTTPWFDEQIPMERAAELGTKKVMEEHAVVGIVMTTDGTITDIPREDYVEAEEKAIRDMIAAEKPFVVIVNSAQPEGENARSVCTQLTQTYGVRARAMNCLTMQQQEICDLLTELMYEFPLREIRFFLPGWVNALPQENTLKAALYSSMRALANDAVKLSDAESSLGKLAELEQVEQFRVTAVDLAEGSVSCELVFPESLFYEILSKETGVNVEDDADLMQTLETLAFAKREYDRIAPALEQVKATGYGIMMPDQSDLQLAEPQIVKKNGNYAVKLKASAPSIHLMRADIETEISPMVGGEQESAQLITFLLTEYEEDRQKLWESNIFGKSLFELVNEGLSTKITRMPDDAKMKMTKALTRMINENTGGMICIIL